MNQQSVFTIPRIADSKLPIDPATVLSQAIAHYHSSSMFCPDVQVRAVYDDEAIRVRFDVKDQYVIAKSQTYYSEVYKDSCVEFFVAPVDLKSYFNFEANCGGTLLASYVHTPPAAPKGEGWFTALPWEKVSQVVAATSMPKLVDPEIVTPCPWHLEMRIPFSIITEYSGAPAPKSGTVWHGNFYKCASRNSHPHWGYWAPMEGIPNFHRPQFFGKVHFC
jgi:hypothetical protein